MIQFSMKTIAGKGYAGEVQSRTLLLKWVNVPKPTTLTFEGKKVPLAKDELTFYQSQMPIAWYKQSTNQQLPNEVHIRLIGKKEELGTLIMNYGKNKKK